MDKRVFLRAGNHHVNCDAVASIEQGSRDRHAPYGGVVIVPYVILHMRTPIIREGFPPIWRVEAEGRDASIILETLERIAAEGDTNQMPAAEPSTCERAIEASDLAA